MGLKHNLGLLIRDEILAYHLEYFLGKRSGGVDYPLYVDYIKGETEAVENSQSPQKPGKNGKEEKKDDKAVKDPKKSEIKAKEVEPEKSRFCFG